MVKWREIPGFEGKYQIHPDGRVRSLNYRNSGKPGELSTSGGKVSLYLDGKSSLFDVQELLKEVFPAPNNNTSYWSNTIERIRRGI